MSNYRIKGTSGSLINQSFKLEQRLVLGRADDCAIRIDHESVAPHHAAIQVEETNRVTITDLGSDSGTRVNGETVSEASLASGDELQIGPCRFLLQAPGLRPERVLTPEATQQRVRRWPWLVAASLAALAAVAWQQGWLAQLIQLIR